jgi:acyl carrier protein
MANKQIKKIIHSISKIINEPVKKINMNSKSSDFNKWDSLAQIKIILEIERIIKKRVQSSKVGELNSIKAISNYIDN